MGGTPVTAPPFGTTSREAGNAMVTIVTYTDHTPPQNHYPHQIVSPSHPSPCCFFDMEGVGTAQTEQRWLFQYQRCRQCGFTVRVILREIPDSALTAALRKTLARSLVRNVPDL